MSLWSAFRGRRSGVSHCIAGAGRLHLRACAVHRRRGGPDLQAPPRRGGSVRLRFRRPGQPGRGRKARPRAVVDGPTAIRGACTIPDARTSHLSRKGR